MERLTEKRDGQNVIPLRQDGKLKWALCSAGMGDAPTQFLYGVHADKLAEYEDLQERLDKQFNGFLEMETVIDTMIECDKQIDKDKELAAAMMITNENVHKYREWEKLDGQGRLPKLPCTVGDVVYRVRENRIEEHMIEKIEVDLDGIWAYSTSGNVYAPDNFGKFVFLVQEDAEAVFKRMNEDA